MVIQSLEKTIWRKKHEKIIGYIFKEATLDLKIKKILILEKVRGEEIAYNICD